jgi:hypothetical protein
LLVQQPQQVWQAAECQVLPLLLRLLLQALLPRSALTLQH